MTTTVVAAVVIVLLLLAIALRGVVTWRDVAIIAALVVVLWLGREVGTT